MKPKLNSGQAVKLQLELQTRVPSTPSLLERKIYELEKPLPLGWNRDSRTWHYQQRDRILRVLRRAGRRKTVQQSLANYYCQGRITHHDHDGF